MANTRQLASELAGASCYHAYLARHPDRALTAPGWSRLKVSAQTTWRERAAELQASTKGSAERETEAFEDLLASISKYTK